MTTLELRGVSKVFANQVEAVKQIDLTVKSGEFVALVGPSGSGKTTLLRLIAGLEDLTQGAILLGSEAVHLRPAHQRNVAFVFQHAALFEHLTVAENLAWGDELRQGQSVWKTWWQKLWRSEPEVSEAVRHIAQRLGIEELLPRLPHTLSGGEQQRVAFGRGCMRHPAVFLLDEPFSSLDAITRAELRHDFWQYQRSQATTTLYVTHDQAEALSLADRIVLMQYGVVQQIGSPQDVYNTPANTFVAKFIGNPGMNVWQGNLLAENGRWLFQNTSHSLQFTLNELPKNISMHEPVLAGIRPEHVKLHPLENGMYVVSHVEYLGDVSLLHISSWGTREKMLQVKLESALAAGLLHSRVQLEFPPDKLHWFHATTQQRIQKTIERT